MANTDDLSSDNDDCSQPRSELDSHANMILLGKHAYIFDQTPKRTCDVVPFDPSLGTSMEIPIVDGAVSYDCPHSHKTFLLIFRNALYVPTLEHNLIPPFILREAGLVVNETAKIHTNDPTKHDHAIISATNDLVIPLQLNGIFSFFHTRSPIESELSNCDPILFTPDSYEWDPYAPHYASHEKNMLDWEGEMNSYRKRIKLNDGTSSSSPTWDIYQDEIDTVISSMVSMPPPLESLSTAFVSAAQLDMHDYASILNINAINSKMNQSLGSTQHPDSYSDDLFLDDFEGSAMYDTLFDGEPLTNILIEIASSLASPPSAIDPKHLSKIWRISNNDAVKVLEQSTCLQRVGHPNSLSRRLPTNDRMLRYRRIDSNFFTDTFFATAKGKSSRGHTCAQLFVSDKGYLSIYFMKSKSEFKDALHLFCKEVGVPVNLVVDPSKEQTSNDVKQFCHKVGTTLRILEESTQWANRAERYIGIFKESIRQDMRIANSPLCLWDYCAERRALIHNVIPKGLFQLQGSNPITSTFGFQPDISNICQFEWYSWCYFREESNVQFPFQKEQLGRVLGPLRNEGNAMTQAILRINGRVVPRRTVRPLTISEIHSPVEIKKREEFDKSITKLLGNCKEPLPSGTKLDQDSMPTLDDFMCEEDGNTSLPPSLLDDPVDFTGKAVYDQPPTDALINMEILLPQGEEFQRATVKRRATDHEGKLVGEFNENPLLNTTVYDVELSDGVVREYSANIIAENIYQQVDSNGYTSSTIDCIVDYSRDSNAISKSNKYVKTKSGQRRLRKTTAGWRFLVRYRDGREEWAPLRLLKEACPIEVSEFAFAHNLHEEAAFCWWVHHTLKKKDNIISSITKRIKHTSHKYGIEVPASLQEAKVIDSKNGNMLWQNAIDKEMRNVAVAFEILPNGQSAPPGWKKSSGHLVFDVKMDFTRKARWVKDGHRTPDPDKSTFAGVVSRDSVRIALTYAALNEISVNAADIQNAYLQAPSSEKHYIICGNEFGIEHSGKVALIRRALYGGKSSGSDFWRHLRTCMQHLNFTPCKADSEIWMRPAIKTDGSKYWEYVLLYVDDVLCISENGIHVITNEIGRYFKIKEPDSVGPPKLYLGNKVSKVTLANGKDAWTFSSSQYVQAAVTNVEAHLKRSNKSLPRRASSPLSTNYRPELDISTELSFRDAAYYQSLIGVLRWIVELGRADITAEASIMASYMASPRQGHLEEVFHIFGYLKIHHNCEMVFDPSEPEIIDTDFPQEDWSTSVYDGVKESLPHNAPEERGQGFIIRTYVDSDHAGLELTRRSRTGFLVFLNNAPIYWFSRKQNCIQTSSHGSELHAMKVCCEYLRGLGYKLRMMGIPVDHPCYIYGDNKSVLVNSSVPTSILKKKSSSIAYHFVREGVAANEWLVSYISTHQNIADLFTKPLPGGKRRTELIRKFLHHYEE